MLSLDITQPKYAITGYHTTKVCYHRISHNQCKNRKHCSKLSHSVTIRSGVDTRYTVRSIHNGMSDCQHNAYWRLQAVWNVKLHHTPYVHVWTLFLDSYCDLSQNCELLTQHSNSAVRTPGLTYNANPVYCLQQTACLKIQNYPFALWFTVWHPS
jgi:hypothetical protein